VLKPVQVIDSASRRAQFGGGSSTLNYYLEWSQIARAVIKKPAAVAAASGATDDAEPEQPPTAAGDRLRLLPKPSSNQ
jgi:hypothetical protein